jgi:hypothetical protein
MLSFDLENFKGYSSISVSHTEVLLGKQFPVVGETILLSGNQVRVTKLIELPVIGLRLEALIEFEVLDNKTETKE